MQEKCSEKPFGSRALLLFIGPDPFAKESVPFAEGSGPHETEERTK